MKLHSDLILETKKILENPFKDFTKNSNYPFVIRTEEDFEKAKLLFLKHNPRDFLQAVDRTKRIINDPTTDWEDFVDNVINFCTDRKNYKNKLKIEAEVRKELGVDEFGAEIQELLELLGWIRKYQDNLKNMTRWILQYANETKQQLEKIEHLKAIEEEELRKI